MEAVAVATRAARMRVTNWENEVSAWPECCEHTIAQTFIVEYSDVRVIRGETDIS